MSLDVFLALLLFAFVSSITPGPNNLMLLASGVNFGFVRTIPHMLGIGIGFLVLLLAVGFGLGAVLTAYPPIHTALKMAGGAYLLYLAWKIAMTRTMGAATGTAKPMTFLQAAAFQWVNVKAWVMAVTAMSLYTSAERPFLSVHLGRLRHCHARLPVRPCAAEMVQHRHGRGAGAQRGADGDLSGQLAPHYPCIRARIFAMRDRASNSSSPS